MAAENAVRAMNQRTVNGICFDCDYSRAQRDVHGNDTTEPIKVSYGLDIPTDYNGNYNPLMDEYAYTNEVSNQYLVKNQFLSAESVNCTSSTIWKIEKQHRKCP